MEWNFWFFLNSVLFGVGLAMDAFCVSLANGLNEPRMKFPKMALIAGIFCLFQTAMPLIGWGCIHTIANVFTSFQKFIPWIALVLLSFLGGKMVWEGLHKKEENEELVAVGIGALLVQGIATSIDALSVGFTIADYTWVFALVEAVIVGVVTFFICVAGLIIGKKFGIKLANKATVLGGILLIGIGIEIFVKGLIGG